jgi:Polyketide cyclase / dehydrase and lipid transport
MASIHKQITIEVAPEVAWDALADWGALHERLARGFVSNTELDGPDRIVTFVNGVRVREVLISCDAEQQRLAWTIVDGPYRHHNGVAQVQGDGSGGTLFTWTADLLPADTAAMTDAAMQHGVESIKATLEADAR